MTAAAATASCNFILGVDYNFDGKGGAASTSSGSGTSSGMTGGGGTGGTEPKSGSALWAFKLGTSGEDTVNAIAVSQANGHVYLTGKTGSAGDLGCMTLADGGATDSGGYLVEIDESGQCLWGLFFGNEAEGTGVAVDPSQNVIFTGTFVNQLKLPGFSDSKTAQSGFAARLDFQTRKLSWTHVFSSDAQSTVIAVKGIAVDTQNAYIGGYINGTLYTDNQMQSPTSGDEDGFVIKCPNVSGGNACTEFVTIVGDMAANPATRQEVLGVALSPDSTEVAIAGMSEGATGFNGTNLTSGDASANAIVGTFKTNNGFNQIHGVFGDDKAQTGYRVAYGASGASPLFFAGKFDGTFSFGTGMVVNQQGQDIFLARFDSDSQTAAKVAQLGNDVSDSNDIGGLVTNAMNDVFLVGTLRGTATIVQGTVNKSAQSKGGGDAFALRLDKDLTPIWFERYGDGANQSVKAVAMATDGDVIIAGEFQGTIDLGNGHAPTATGGTDIFVAKLKP
jgi:hypothetical protein